MALSAFDFMKQIKNTNLKLYFEHTILELFNENGFKFGSFEELKTALDDELNELLSMNDYDYIKATDELDRRYKNLILKSENKMYTMMLFSSEIFK